MDHETKRPWWSVAQLAEHYGVSAAYIYAQVKCGKLPAITPPIRVSDSDRRAWEESRRIHVEAPPAPQTKKKPYAGFWSKV